MDGRARALNLALLRCERATGRTRLESLPAEIQIEATNRCARSCPTCARHYFDKPANAPGDLQPAVFEALAPLFPSAERVLVGGYGEPLLAPITLEIIARAHAAGCATAIITSGADLTAPLAENLASAGLDEIVLSIDGANDEALLKRRGLTWPVIADALEMMRQVRPEISVRFNVTLQADNLDELPAIVEQAAKYRVGAVTVLHQKIYTRTQAASSVLGIAAHAAEVFAAARRLAAERGVRLELPPLSGERPCEQPFRLLAVRHDGLVQGCCSALFESPLPRLVLGRLPGDDPVELWNAPPMLAARAHALGQGPVWPACAACAFRVFTVVAHQRFLDGAADG